MHCSVESDNPGELDEIRRFLEREYPNREWIITNSSVSLHAIPELDDFTDEIAERVKEEVTKEIYNREGNRPL